jgi:hypothetical protein
MPSQLKTTAVAMAAGAAFNSSSWIRDVASAIVRRRVSGCAGDVADGP